MHEAKHLPNDDNENAPQRRGWWNRGPRGLSVIREVVVSVVDLVANFVFFLVAVTVLMLVALPWNLWKYVEATLRTLWRLILGKAIIQKRLEGLVLEAKLDVLRIGLELEKIDRLRSSDETTASDASGRDRVNLSVEEIEMFKRVIGFDEKASRGHEFWIPEREWLERRWTRLQKKWKQLRDVQEPVPFGDVAAADRTVKRGDSGSRGMEHERRDAKRDPARPISGTHSPVEADPPAETDSRAQRKGANTGSPKDADRGFSSEEAPSAGREDGYLLRDAQWAALTMELLNEAERHLEKNVETALRTYLRVDRLLVDGEHRLHRRKKEHETRVDRSNVWEAPVVFARRAWDGWVRDHRDRTDHAGGSNDPIGVRARVALHRADGLDGDARTVVRELLCGTVGQPPKGDTEVGTNSAESDESAAGSRPNNDPKPSVSVTELDRALRELNRHRLEEYRRLESLRITVLSFVGVPALLLGLVLFYFPSFMQGALEPVRGELGIDMVRMPLLDLAFSPHPEQLFFTLVLVFGALGAAISGTQKVQNDSESLEYLQDILGYWLALVRMLIGAISAFIVTIFLFSGAVNETFLTLPLIFGASIAAGFSERFALRAITSFETRTMSKSTYQKREAVV